MTERRLTSEPRVDRDVSSAFEWYEVEQVGLGQDFIDELLATDERIADGPLKYESIRPGIRRALVRRFPYAVYFVVRRDVIAVLAVLHASRDPAAWQKEED